MECCEPSHGWTTGYSYVQMFVWTFVCVCTCETKGKATLRLTCVTSQQLVPGGSTGGSFRSSHTLGEWLPIHGLSCAPLLLALTLKEGAMQLGM